MSASRSSEVVEAGSSVVDAGKAAEEVGEVAVAAGNAVVGVKSAKGVVGGRLSVEVGRGRRIGGPGVKLQIFIVRSKVFKLKRNVTI